MQIECNAKSLLNLLCRDATYLIKIYSESWQKPGLPDTSAKIRIYDEAIII